MKHEGKRAEQQARKKRLIAQGQHAKIKPKSVKHQVYRSWPFQEDSTMFVDSDSMELVSVSGNSITREPICE